jgi:hypothetical protein
MAGRSPVSDLVTSMACVTADGSWGSVRASPNTPELVTVVESPTCGQRMRDMFEPMDAVLHPPRGLRVQQQIWFNPPRSVRRQAS